VKKTVWEKYLICNEVLSFDVRRTKRAARRRRRQRIVTVLMTVLIWTADIVGFVLLGAVTEAPG
jgi:hypothetical protein